MKLSIDPIRPIRPSPLPSREIWNAGQARAAAGIPRRAWIRYLVLACAVLFAALAGHAGPEEVRFAVIGDFGADSGNENEVAQLVRGLSPDFIITTGDNNYPSGAGETIDANVGKYFHDFISPYKGRFGPGATENRFFPALGNHDWGNKKNNPNGARAYLAWFELPGNERYYDFVRGPVHFFVVNSDPNEPDGVSEDSRQALWLKEQLSKARETWKVVYFHHPPFTTGTRHSSCRWMDWPFAAWGADAVLSGHEHSYERLSVKRKGSTREIPHFIVGSGGAKLSGFSDRKRNGPATSQKRLSKYGAMLVRATPELLTFEYYTTEQGMTPVDHLVLRKGSSRTGS